MKGWTVLEKFEQSSSALRAGSAMAGFGVLALVRGRDCKSTKCLGSMGQRIVSTSTSVTHLLNGELGGRYIYQALSESIYHVICPAEARSEVDLLLLFPFPRSAACLTP